MTTYLLRKIFNHHQSGEWELMDLLVTRNEKMYTCCPFPYSDVTYYIIIKRRPHFYFYNMILPCIVLTFVSLLAFLVPPESGNHKLKKYYVFISLKKYIFFRRSEFKQGYTRIILNSLKSHE